MLFFNKGRTELGELVFSLMGFEPRTACWTERINPLLFWRERVRGRERESERRQ